MSSSKIPVVVLGAAGKMGRRLTAAVASHPELTLAGAAEAPGHPELGKDAGSLAGIPELGVKLGSELAPLLSPGAVVIDFTAPGATLSHLAACVEKRAAMVIGTTGFSPDQSAKVRELAAQIPCVIAPNMSVGVNLLFYLVAEAARGLGDDFDLEIVEAHHRLKKDAPSGTALKLGEIAAEARGWPLAEAGRYGREGMIGARPDKEIGIMSVRAGDIVGEHTVIFAGPGERIELVHRAHSRDIFARGAARAAAWVAGRDPGIYSMFEVLGLDKR